MSYGAACPDQPPTRQTTPTPNFNTIKIESF
jgi:hypothetical protein